MQSPTARAAPHFSKPELRARMRAARAACDQGWGVRLAGHVLARGAVRVGAVVAGSWPLAGEIDVRPLLLALAGRGHVVALPRIAGGGLSFHRWRPGDRLVPGRFGTLEPVGAAVRPDLVLAPLLAFDRSGGRLGYGGGYYDRALAGLADALVIGCGFSVQECAAVPVEAHDRRLDAVATELGFWAVGEL